MTTYAYRTDTAEVLAMWDAGIGACSTLVARVADPQHALRLTAALTSLSETAWRTYTHPPTSQGDPEAANTSAWRQEDAREALGRLPQVLTDPHLAQGSHLLVSLIPTEEAGHQVGRVLHAIADPAGDP